MDTSALPASVVAWTKPGNAMPNGGYVAPLFPQTWLKNAPVAQTLFSGLDQALETGRFYLDVLRAAHLIGLAVGTDLDDLGALLGLVRLAGESDTQFRARIPATAQHGVSASSIPDMQTFLSAAVGVPVQVQDTGIGTFMVTLLGTITNPQIVLPLVRSVKAAGTQPSAQMLVSRPNQVGARFGAFRFGAATHGSAGLYIPLS